MTKPAQAVRHRRVDRLLHWLFALSIVLLLGTGLLPAFGVNFDWVPMHWITGLVFLALLLVHALRSVLVKRLADMWLGPGDFRAGAPAKYSVAQKLMHNAVALLALGAVITGLMMMVRIDTPVWERNPYWLEADAWGLVYVLHGLVALSFVSVIMLHVYFSLRPEKRGFLRAMLRDADPGPGRAGR